MMFHDFARRIGADIRPLERRFSDTVSNLGAAKQLWLIAPGEISSPYVMDFMAWPIGTDDEDALAGWVVSGGTLVIAPNYAAPGFLESILKRVGYSIYPSSHATSGEKKTRLRLEPAGESDLLYGVSQIESFLKYGEDKGTLLRFSGEGKDAQVLLADEYGPAVIMQPVGDGSVILVADQYIFSNFLLPAADNAQLAANILAMAGGGPIYFDEYFHGRQKLRTLSDILRTKAGHGVAFLLIVAGIALYSAGRRFGAALPPPPSGRRSPAEYVVSMGLLFRRAAAAGLALHVMERDFAGFLKQRYRLRTLDIEEVEKQLRLMGNTDYVEIISILGEFEMLGGRHRPPIKRLVKLSMRIDALKGA